MALSPPVDWLTTAWADPESQRWLRAAVVAFGSVAGAWFLEVAVVGLLSRLARRTSTNLDDRALRLIRRPLFVTLVMLGFDWALSILQVHDATAGLLRSLLQSLAILLWANALVSIGSDLLKHAATHAKETSFIQPRTVPLFDIITKTSVIALAIYLGMVAWKIDIGAWVASAGVIGIAVGFAARDSLANYFAGVFIVVDAPYKLGDIILLDDGSRGRVTEIGLRSTRIQTRDNIEINIPNSILGNQKIVNRSAGPTILERVHTDTSVAYGSNVDQVVDVLRRSAKGMPYVAKDREPIVYFTSFGDSGLNFRVLVWADDPRHYEQVLHELNMRVYKSLNAAGIEIPYPKQDVYVKELPTPGDEGSSSS